MVRSLILVSFLAAAGAPAAVDAVPEVIRVDEPARVIVEFTGAPAVYDRTAAASRSATLARFRQDLASIVAPITTSASNVPAAKRIRREYTVTFFGAAAEISGKQADAVRKLPYVRGVYLDRSVQALSSKAVDDTLLSDARTRVNSMNLPTQGEGITVAVIDTGIDYRHPALGGAFGASNKVAGGYDFYNDDADPLDDNGHGTHVAGIIAADSEALIGVAPKATLFAFKVLSSGGSGSSSDVIAGIEAAADPNHDGDPSDHLDVANLSLGGLGSADDPQARAVDGSVAAGVVVCVAAGNSGGFAIIGSPGTSRSAITVGATDDLGAMTSFSSRGPTPGDLIFKPDVVAPGNKITSSFPS